MKTRYKILSLFLALSACIGLLILLAFLVFHIQPTLSVEKLISQVQKSFYTPLFWKGSTQTIHLKNPAILYVLSLLPFLWLPSFFSKTTIRTFGRILQVGFRSILWMLLIIALAQPFLEKQDKNIAIVALLDVSDSMGENQINEALSRIRELEKMAQKQGESFHVLAFAEKPWSLPSPLSPPLSIHEIKTHVGHTQETHLQAAIQQSYGFFPPHTLQKIILFSDGRQTKGNAWLESEFAAIQHIQIDSFSPISQTVDLPEIVMTSLEKSGQDQTIPPQVGAPFFLQGTIETNTPQTVKVILQQNGKPNQEQPEQTIKLQKGTNPIVFRTQVNEPGEVIYQIEVLPLSPSQPLLDHFLQNNRVEQGFLIQSRPRILYIEGDSRSQNLLAKALQKEQIQVDIKPPSSIPHHAQELRPYDLVLLSDVPVTLLSHSQIIALQTYVKDQGGGLFFAAGENVFSPLSSTYTELESMLPIRFQQTKKREQPSVAVMLCIDRSGSMNGPKIELAKDAAKAALDALTPDDLIGIVPFDTQAIQLVQLQPVRNRIRIASTISRITAGGGTDLFAPLKEAYDQISTSSASIKHVILLTDGQAPYAGIIDLVDQMNAQKITVSTVGVGSGADQTLLQSIADHGNGRFYFSQDASSVPQIFTKEVKEVANASFQEEPVSIFVKKQAEFLQGIPISTAPKLYGYAPALTKPRSETILMASTGDPLLVRWQFGLGKVLAFTSDIKNRWAVDLVRWPFFSKLFTQMVRSAMKRPFQQSRYEFQVDSFPPEVSIKMSAFDEQGQFISGLQSSLDIVTAEPGWLPGSPIAPQKILQKSAFSQIAPGLYEARFTLEKQGTYLLHVTHQNPLAQHIVGEHNEMFSLSSSLEFRLPTKEQNLLPLLMEKTKGQPCTNMSQVFDFQNRSVYTLQPFWMHFAFASLFFYLLDITLRRILATTSKRR